jgi:glutathione S-transferase
VGASGNSYKVALYLNCAGLDWEPVGVDFAGGEKRDPAWRAATNGMGEVPVLEADGRQMTQSVRS